MSAQKSKPVGLLGAVAGLVGFSALAGILVTAMVAPALAVTSMTANTSIGIFDSLPSYIQLSTLSQRNTLYGLRDGKQVPFAQVFDQNREEVSWSNVSPYLKDALISGEDRRFYQHGGIDVPSVFRAAQGYVTSGGGASAGGGSTLAQQLVKNILIQQALNLPTQKEQEAAYKEATDIGPARKLKEMKLAIGLEKTYSKNEVLLGYLNIAGFGGTTYGIESAAQQYFGVSAKDVTLVQAASLIAIVQQPNKLNLDDPKKYPANKQRRDLILNNMFELGYINQQQRDDAVKTPVQPNLHPPQNGCLYAADAKFFCDYVLKNVKNFDALGTTPQQREENWKRGGYDVYTTIDLTQQDVAQDQINHNTPATETRLALGSAASAVQVGTGRILVMAQNKVFHNTKEGSNSTTTAVNFNTDAAYGQSTGFPTGSTYKIFTLVDWLENGHGVNEVVNGNVTPYSTFPAACIGGWKSATPVRMRNDAGNPGPVTVRRATAQSINNAFLSMAFKLDLCQINDVARSMGAHRADGQPLQVLPAAVLGTNEIAPLTMAAALATVSSGGTYCNPIAVDKFVGPDGKELPGQNAECRQALTPEVAAAAAYALGGPTGGYPGSTGAAANPRDGHALIGKTGTAETDHAWMLASTTKVSMALWIGNITGHANLEKFSGPAGNYIFASKFNIFKNTMRSIDSVYGGDAKFPDPPASLLNGVTQGVPNVVGQTADQATSLLQSLGLNATVGAPVPSALPAGVIATTDPGAGARVSKGYVVTLHPSDGTLNALMPNVVGMTQPDAQKALTDQGFTGTPTVTWTKVDPTAATCGKVISSTPESGAATTKDVAISLTMGSVDGHKPSGGGPGGCLPPGGP